MVYIPRREILGSKARDTVMTFVVRCWAALQELYTFANSLFFVIMSCGLLRNPLGWLCHTFLACLGRVATSPEVARLAERIADMLLSLNFFSHQHFCFHPGYAARLISEEEVSNFLSRPPSLPACLPSFSSPVSSKPDGISYSTLSTSSISPSFPSACHVLRSPFPESNK